MPHVHCLRSLLLLGLAAGGLLGGVSRGAAVEPVREFVDALRQEGLFEQANDYLDLLRTSALVSDEVKESIGYEQGVTFLTNAAANRDFVAKEKLLDEARSRFQQFIDASPKHRLKPAANNQLASILVQRGQVKVAMAAKASASEKKSLLDEGKKLYTDAQLRFASAEGDFAAELKKIPKHLAPDETELKAERQQIGGDLAQAQLMSASIDYELSKTVEPGSAEFKKHLETAAKKYAALFEDYRRLGAGLYAHLWEGRCYQDLGDMRQALGCFQDLLEVPPKSTAVRSIQASAIRYALECWTSPQEKRFAEAGDRGEQWLRSLPPNTPPDSETLAVHYLTAVAYQSALAQVDEKDPNRRKYQLAAKQHADQVAKRPGEFQKPARALAAKLGGKASEDDHEPKTFDEARDLGHEAFERVQQAAIGLKLLEENPADDSAETIAQTKREKDEQLQLAIKYYRLALSLVDKKTALEDLQRVRSHWCHCAWESGEFFDSAVLGDFLARQYPDTAEGRQGARIAMWSFVKIYNISTDPDKSFESDQIMRSAEYILKRWPGQDEAHEAAGMLLNFAVQQRQLDKAQEFLKLIPENSPQRGQAELKTGQALWRTYQKSSQTVAEERPPQTELDQLKKQAQDVLEKGIERMQAAGDASPTLVDAMLSLVQINVDTGRPDKAIQRLEDEKIGPLALVKTNSPATAREGFATETYRLALRAYVAEQQLDKAEQAMDALEKLVGKSQDAKAAETLTLIYIALGRELQQQLQGLSKSGQKKEMETVSKGFELFLSRIGKRETGNTFNSLSWVAETFYSLASGFDDNSAKLSPQAKNYYEQAVHAYERILATAAKDEKFVPQPEALVGLRLRLAVCQRRLGKFDDAIKLILEVLKDKPMNLTAQVQAAETHQARGAVDPKGYFDAIKGTNPDATKQNIIWGWGRLAQITKGNPKFDDTFFQARLKLAEARYRFGLTVSTKSVQRQTIDQAKKDLRITYEVRPTLGGPETSAEYDRLLKAIQNSLGEKTIGLQEFKQALVETNK